MPDHDHLDVQIPHLVKGSWEDLLVQGQQMAARQDDAVIPHLQRLIDRLSKFPAGQRMAANGRLNDLLLQAAIDLQRYLCFRDRYAEALDVNLQARPFLAAALRIGWDAHAAAIQVQAGDLDAGVAAFCQLAETAGMLQWTNAILVAAESGRLELAQSAVLGAERWLNRTYAGAMSEEMARNDLARLCYLRSRLALCAGNADESLAWFEQARTLSQAYVENPQLLYIQMIDQGAYAHAERLLRHEQANSIRAGFWQGIVHLRRNHPSEAQNAWRRVTHLELPEEESTGFLELVLAHYYLGDKEGIGLGSVLNALQADNQNWYVLILAGLGWAMRDDLNAARADLQMALMRQKSEAAGRKLTATWWNFCTDLLNETQQQAIVEFFEHAQIQRHA